MKSEVKGRTGCGRCYECKHHVLKGSTYVCLNQDSTAGRSIKKGNDGIEVILPNFFVYDFHDCCEVEDD